MTRAWPQVRAILVALVIAVGLLDGCPVPAAKRVPEGARPALVAAKTTRRIALKPFRPLGELLRLRQIYKLFPTADESQYRMWVEARGPVKREWEVLYRSHDPDHDFLADAVEYRKLRGAWNPGRDTRTGYGPFVEWISKQIFDATDDYDRVRVRMERIRLRPRDGTFDALGEFDHEKQQRRPRRGRSP